MKNEEDFKSIGSSSSKCVRLLCSSDDVLNHILSEMRDIKTCMSSRLTSLELKMSLLVQTCNKISKRLDTLDKCELKNKDEKLTENVHQNDFSKLDDIHCEDEKDVSNGLKILPLSSESDYPNGSWLGDPLSVTNRVRCSISPQNLFHINSTCFTPEKMALCLLDKLFTRQELAVSNISGRSRWGKKQLNPLLIYGIKAHLKYKFFITEKDWHKICQNMGAKCRFAWKRNQKIIGGGGVGKSKFKMGCQRMVVKKRSLDPISSSQEISFDFGNLNHPNLNFNRCAKVMTHSPCELRILNATPAQIANLQESQEIILAEDMLPDSNDAKSIMIDTSSADVSMNTVVMDGVVDTLGSELTSPIRQEVIEDEDETTTVVTTNHPSVTSTATKDGGHHSHHESLTHIRSSHLEDGLQLEVELGHQSREEDADS